MTAVRDGNSLMLDSGIRVRLGGTLAPRSAGPRAASTAEPLAETAQAALARLTLGKPVRLGLDAEETDRYRRMEAQLFLDDGSQSWVEAALVAAGLARVDVTGPNTACAAELLADEQAARGKGLGIWGDPYYSVREAAKTGDLSQSLGHYVLVEGKVVSVGEARKRTYLDFGRIWKDDLTATIDDKVKPAFVAAGLDPTTLKGRRLRLRGWLEQRDGPLLELSSPLQIEVLDRQ